MSNLALHALPHHTTPLSSKLFPPPFQPRPLRPLYHCLGELHLLRALQDQGKARVVLADFRQLRLLFAFKLDATISAYSLEHEILRLALES